MKQTIVVSLVFVMGLVCGCRKSVTVTGDDGSKATVTQSGKNVTINVTGKDGGTMQVSGGEGGVALPEGFPKDVPIYPGAKVLSTMKNADGMYVVLQTSDAKDKVSAFYKEKLKATGWEIKETTEMPQGAMFRGAKGGVSLTTSIGAGDALTTVTLIVGKEN